MLYKGKHSTVTDEHQTGTQNRVVALPPREELWNCLPIRLLSALLLLL